MPYTISNAKDDLKGIVHGTTLNKVTNLNQVFSRAARTVVSRIDPDETIRYSNLTNPIHDEVYNYALPSDVKGRKLIDIRPQAGRTLRDKFSNTYGMDFDLRKAVEDNNAYIDWNSASKTIRIDKNVGSNRTTIAPLNAITGEGTWSVGGVASGLSVDSQYYVSGNSSLKFALANGANQLNNTTLTAIDLSTFDEVGTFFIWVYISDTSKVTSFQLLWGNDLTTNYWSSATVTAQADSTAFRAGWNLLKFEWNGATESGSVAPSAIDSVRLVINATGAVTDFRANSLVISLGYIWEIVYYSKFLFRSEAGTWSETTTSDSDIVNLDTDSYNIWLYECAILIAQQLQGNDARSDIAWFSEELYGKGDKMGLYRKYNADHPSQAIRPRTFYYRVK